jgi:putative redox protein
MEIKVHRGEGKLQHVIELASHTLLTDAPRMYGREETGPEPYDLLAAALRTCTALTVTMYAHRKNMDPQDIDTHGTYRRAVGNNLGEIELVCAT